MEAVAPVGLPYLPAPTIGSWSKTCATFNVLDALDGGGGSLVKRSRVSIARQALPQAISLLDARPQRFLHLRKQVHRELCVTTVAPPFIDHPALMRDEALSFGNMSLRFHEVLRDV
jgi:hypothetical protein